MSVSGRYYEESGSFDIHGPVLMLAGGAITGLVCGAIYGYWCHYVTLIIVSILGTIALPFALGAVVGMAGKSGNVRNSLMVGAFGLVAGLVAVYASWVTWMQAKTDDGTFPWSPDLFLTALSWFAENYSITVTKASSSSSGGAPISGMFLQGLWLVEAAILVLGPTFMAMGYVSDIPFCERCHKWLDEPTTFPKVAIGEPDALKSALEASNYDPLYTLAPATPGEAQFSELELRRCTGCQQQHFLTVRKVTRKLDEHGKEEFEKSDLATNLIVEAAHYQGLLEGKKPGSGA